MLRRSDQSLSESALRMLMPPLLVCATIENCGSSPTVPISFRLLERALSAIGKSHCTLAFDVEQSRRNWLLAGRYNWILPFEVLNRCSLSASVPWNLIVPFELLASTVASSASISIPPLLVATSMAPRLDDFDLAIGRGCHDSALQALANDAAIAGLQVQPGRLGRGDDDCRPKVSLAT